MKTKHLSLGLTLLALVGTAYGQEFVSSQAQSQSQMQASNPPSCQENCTEAQANSGQGNGGQGSLQIDRSGMDKASIHLQVLQQTSQKFSEPSNSKKNNNDDKKSTNKNQTLD